MRSRYFITLCLALLVSSAELFSAPLAHAQIAAEPEKKASDLSRLIGANLQAAFLGKTMDGIYKTPRQRTGTNIFTERFNPDGSTAYREGDVRDIGRWAVNGGIICFLYQGALSGEPSCFTVYESGTCLYSYNPANIGRDGYPLDDNLWSAKTIIRGDISTCDDLLS